MDWTTHHAAIWRSRKGTLRPVQNIDPITLDDLLGIDWQKQSILENTERFLKGKPANNALLWGSRGTGKSSLVKAVFNEFRAQGLRAVEVDKADLTDLPEIVDAIRDESYRFLIFTDDLSFDESENSYRHLKSVLEGSIEMPPDNILIYATSNRRHLLPERFEDNDGTHAVNGEIHYGDAVEEKISLSDRFGLWLSFYPLSMADYLDIVDSLFPNVPDRTELHRKAKQFTVSRGSRSGRTARQFFNSYS